MKRVIIALMFVLSLAGNTLVQAQENRLMSREALDSLMSPQVMASGATVLRFETLLCDFGVMYESDSPLSVDYPFVNVSGRPVHITRTTTNCGCTVTEIADSVLAPGERGVVRVRFNPRRRAGTVDTNTFVYTSFSDKEPVAKLTLLGNVVDKDEWNHLPCSMGMLKLKRKEIVFEPVKAGTSPQQRIPCANVGTVPLSLTSRLLPSFATLFTEPREIAPGEEGDIVIVINGDMLPDNAPRHFNVLVDGIGGRISDRTIKVKLEK